MLKKINYLILSLLIIAIYNLLMTNLSYSQDSQNKPLPLRFILPQAYTQQPYGIDDADIPVSVGPFDNYIINSANGFLEPDICVNPVNPLNFVTTDNRIIPGGGTPYVFNTTDGGITWGTPTIATNSGDPAFTADANGNFYLVALNLPVTGFYVYKSVNGGASWSSPVNINTGGSVDKEWIAADQTTGTYHNNVYIVYYNFAGNGVGFERSTDNGATWSLISSSLDTFAVNPGPDVAVDANGKVYVAWDNGSGTSIRTSTDGGTTFTPVVSANNHSEPGTAYNGRNALKTIHIRVNGMPHIAIDLTNGPFRNYVYCLYGHNPPGPDQADVMMTRSTDGGVTWNTGTPVRVNDDAGLTDQWDGDVSVDNQGRVWAVWYDSRNDDPANQLTELYGAVSTDGGLTFLPKFKVSNQNFNPNVVAIFQQSGQAYYMGDYKGISGKTITFPNYCCQNNSHLCCKCSSILLHILFAIHPMQRFCIDDHLLLNLLYCFCQGQ